MVGGEGTLSFGVSDSWLAHGDLHWNPMLRRDPRIYNDTEAKIVGQTRECSKFRLCGMTN
jgi:hypothetical protein